LFLVPVLLLGLSANASAGLFGGFAKDGCYRLGGDQLCTASSPSGAGGVCKTLEPGDLAKRKFSLGSKQLGASRRVLARKQGTHIEVLAEGGQAPLVTWDAEEILGGVGDVYLDDSKTWVAVEYTARFAGRVTEKLVVLPVVLPKAVPAAASLSKPPVDVVPAAKKSSESKEVRSLLDDAAKWSRRRRTQAKAQKALQEVLQQVPGHPEALYGLALLHMKRKDTAAVLATLGKLAASKHPRQPKWRVEARLDLQFKSLRGDPAFRKAVGIVRSPGETPSLYERLVALGGTWEQESIPCEEPQVNLRLRRDLKQRFDLTILSKCQGMAETTRLDGTWSDDGGTGLALRLPNMNVAADSLSCKIERCTDDVSEDCLRCQPDPKLEFLLRVVRR